MFAHRESRPSEKSLDGAELYAGLCDGTRLTNAEVVQDLGVGQVPLPGTSGVVAVGRTASWWWILAGLGSLVVVGRATARSSRRLVTSRHPQPLR